MALVTTKELMLDAQKNHYAIGAFNAENMEMVQAIILVHKTVFIKRQATRKIDKKSFWKNI